MKKIYITPALLVVQMRTIHMMAESLGVYTSAEPDNYIDDSNQILTKGNNSLWDGEW